MDQGNEADAISQSPQLGRTRGSDVEGGNSSSTAHPADPAGNSMHCHRIGG